MHANRLGAAAYVAVTVYYRDGERVRRRHERAIGVRTRYRPLGRAERIRSGAVAPVDRHRPRSVMVRIAERRPLQRESHRTDQDVLVTPGGHDGWLIKGRRLGDYDVFRQRIGRAAVVRDGERDRVRTADGVVVRGTRAAPSRAVPEVPLLARDRAIRIATGACKGAVQRVAARGERGRGRLVRRCGAGDCEAGLGGVARRYSDRPRVLRAHHAVARDVGEPDRVIARGEPVVGDAAVDRDRLSDTVHTHRVTVGIGAGATGGRRNREVAGRWGRSHHVERGAGVGLQARDRGGEGVPGPRLVYSPVSDTGGTVPGVCSFNNAQG